MGAGILVCGLNGAGKRTLGKALAEQLGGYFLDNEDLYFPKTDPAYLYAPPVKIRAGAYWYSFFVFAAVKGDYGDALYPFSGTPF